jgi:hypothetical protein
MNVFDEEKRGFTALYTPSRSEDGITVAILLELLRYVRSWHLSSLCLTTTF